MVTTPDTSPIHAPGMAGSPRGEPAYATYWLLRIGFVVLPLWMGLDKFVNALTDWPAYLAPWIVDLAPFSAQTVMYIVGVIEIIAAVLVAIAPRFAAWVVAAWLAGIIINLLTLSGFYDVALRDFGLLLAAVSLALLARQYRLDPNGDLAGDSPVTEPNPTGGRHA